MSTKISALPAAAAPNITDTNVFPMVDATTTTVKLTTAQLRTQLSSTVQSFADTVSVVVPSAANGAAHQMVVTQAGADGVLGPINFVLYSTPSATGSARFVELTVADNVANRLLKVTGPLSLSSTLAVTGASTLSGLVTIASTVTSAAGTGTDIVLGATTQTTVGVAGASSALPAQPLGYLVFYKGTTKCCFPYYNG